MRRRALLASAATGLALGGCLGSDRVGDDRSPSTTSGAESTGTTAGSGESATAGSDESSAPTATATPVDLPENCPFSPDVEGLPARPAAPTLDSMTEFVAAYEQVLAAASSDYRGFNRFQHVSTERSGDAFRVYHFVEPLPATPTPGAETAAGATTGTTNGTTSPTPHPTDAPSTYNVGYLVDPYRIVRWKRPSALTYRFSPYDGYDPLEGGDLVACRRPD